MRREDLEERLDTEVTVTLFDGSEYTGVLKEAWSRVRDEGVGVMGDFIGKEAKLEHDLNYTYPYNTMSADWGSEVYEDGFRYYEIPQEYKDAGGCFPEIVQVYLWCECKEYGVDYYMVLALIERESGYHWDKVGDNGNSKGYMQIYEKWHTERMEVEGVTDLFNPYQNIRVGLNCLREIQDKYLASSGENCVLMVYNMGESGAKKLWAKDIYSSAYSREVIARAQELRQELTQE